MQNLNTKIFLTLFQYKPQDANFKKKREKVKNGANNIILFLIILKTLHRIIEYLSW